MKIALPTAQIAAIILALGSFALVGTSAMGAMSAQPSAVPAHVPQTTPTQMQSFKLKCLGENEQSVTFTNIGDAPVPAGTVIKWHVPQGTFKYDGNVTILNAYSGTSTLQQPLNPAAQVQFNLPTPAPGGNQGNAPPVVQILGALEAIAALRPCTFTISPALIRAGPSTIAPKNP
jgi:hypothetical protein